MGIIKCESYGFIFKETKFRPESRNQLTNSKYEIERPQPGAKIEENLPSNGCTEEESQIWNQMCHADRVTSVRAWKLSGQCPYSEKADITRSRLTRASTEAGRAVKF